MDLERGGENTEEWWRAMCESNKEAGQNFSISEKED